MAPESHKIALILELECEDKATALAAAEYIRQKVMRDFGDGSTYELPSYDIAIFGPNLYKQEKGTFHIHKLHCADCRRYGPDKEFGGDDGGWAITADTKAEVVLEVYADQISEGASYESCRTDLWFAPCISYMPEGEYSA